MNEFLQGFGIGLSVAAPVGPIGLLCIRRSIAQGFLIGFSSGLGAAAADAAYGSVAAFGLTLISNFLVDQRIWLGLVGGLFLCYLGLATFFAKPSDEAAKSESGTGTSVRAFLSTLLLTLANPMTVLMFGAIFAGFGFGRNPAKATCASAAFMVMGVFLGSAGWWLFLSGTAGYLRGKITFQWMTWINRLSGLIILIFGVLALVRFRIPV